LALLGALLAAPAVFAARAQRAPDPDYDSPDRIRGVDHDDPRARREAMREWRGEPDADARWRILQEALKERDHYGAWQSGLVQPLAPVTGSTFINVGPTRADLEQALVFYNGAYHAIPYTAIDSGRARQIITHPSNPNILFMATSGGGVWKSFDRGAGWEPITDSLGTLSVGTLAMDPSSPDLLYLGFGDPFDVLQPGLVQSRDGGATWSDPVKLVATYTLNGNNYTFTASSVTDIKIDPSNSQILLVTTNQGLFRSADAGTTWQHIRLTGAGATDIYYWMWSAAYAGPHTWLTSGERVDITGGANNGGMGFWRSTDDGVTWSWNGTALPGGSAEAAAAGRGTLAAAASTVSDVNTSRIFMVAGAKDGLSTRDVYRSDDGGKSFVSLGVNASGHPTNPNAYNGDLNVMHDQAWYNHAIIVDPGNPDAVFVGGNFAMIRSTDGGQTWSVLSDWLPAATGVTRPYVHAAFHAFAVGIDGTFYAGTDGGIFLSSTALGGAVDSVLFSSTHNDGLVTHLVYNVACAPETWPADMQGWMAGGMQDNGTRVRKSATTTFDALLGADGIGLAVSATAANGVPDTFLASVEYGILKSTTGGQSWIQFDSNHGITNRLPFFVKIARDEAATDPVSFLTGTSPAAIYLTAAGGDWVDVSGTLHWQFPVATTTGFQNPLPGGAGIGIRNVAAHPRKAGVWGAVSGNWAYVTNDSGTNWLVSVRANPSGQQPDLGVYGLSSIAFDLNDLTGQSYYITAVSMDLRDNSSKHFPGPAGGFAHLYKTTDGGATWTPLGGQPIASFGLPAVPFDVVKVDPNDPLTLYVGTGIGLYRSSDGGQNFSRFGASSLPLVEVSDLCIAPASKRLTVGSYGRGFWEISTDATTNAAGVKGRGDTNFDLRIDGQDLIDLADAWGSTQASVMYRYQADLTGAVNAVDDADLAALLAKFGGQP
jgi:photosystem II stability/assembly factor-like uncharacterized protein